MDKTLAKQFKQTPSREAARKGVTTGTSNTEISEQVQQWREKRQARMIARLTHKRPPQMGLSSAVFGMSGTPCNKPAIKPAPLPATTTKAITAPAAATASSSIKPPECDSIKPVKTKLTVRQNLASRMRLMKKPEEDQKLSKKVNLTFSGLNNTRLETNKHEADTRKLTVFQRLYKPPETSRSKTQVEFKKPALVQNSLSRSTSASSVRYLNQEKKKTPKMLSTKHSFLSVNNQETKEPERKAPISTNNLRANNSRSERNTLKTCSSLSMINNREVKTTITSDMLAPKAAQVSLKTVISVQKRATALSVAHQKDQKKEHPMPILKNLKPNGPKLTADRQLKCQRRSLSMIHIKNLGKKTPANVIVRSQSVPDIEGASGSGGAGSQLHPGIPSPIVEEQEKFERRSRTPGLCKSTKNVSFFAPTLRKTVSPTQDVCTPQPDVLSKRLAEWLNKHGKNVQKFHHLKCFGVHEAQVKKHMNRKHHSHKDKTKSNDAPKTSQPTRLSGKRSAECQRVLISGTVPSPIPQDSSEDELDEQTKLQKQLTYSLTDTSEQSISEEQCVHDKLVTSTPSIKVKHVGCVAHGPAIVAEDEKDQQTKLQKQLTYSLTDTSEQGDCVQCVASTPSLEVSHVECEDGSAVVDEEDKENLFKGDIKRTINGCLEDLHNLIDAGYPRDQCDDWLLLILKRWPSVVDTPTYWECRAALEEACGHFNMAVDCYERAIIRGAKPDDISKSLDQLLEKFSILDLNQKPPAEGRDTPRRNSTKVLDARNVFKSSIIKFALQQKAVKKISANLGVEATSLHYVATPVRRSTRKSASQYKCTPNILCVNSLNQLEPSLRDTLVFHSNAALQTDF